MVKNGEKYFSHLELTATDLFCCLQLLLFAWVGGRGIARFSLDKDTLQDVTVKITF
jgi:hypothetical protein